MNHALKLESPHGRSKHSSSSRQGTRPGRPARQSEGHLRAGDRTAAGAEHTEPTFVPSLGARSYARPKSIDEDSPTVVRHVNALVRDAHRLRNEHLLIESASSRVSTEQLSEISEISEITDVTEVSAPPAAIRARKPAMAPALSPRAGSLIVPATPPQGLPAPAPRAAGTPRVLEAVSLFEAPPARPATPAPAPADIAPPQARPQARSHQPAPALAPQAPVDASLPAAVPAPKRQAAKKPRRSISMGFTFTMFFLVCGVLFLHGWDFYILNLDGRIEHPDFNALRPSGTHGYAYGVSGTVLIFLNLLYLARRRLARAKLGSMRTWLDLHVFTGVLGCAFIIFHSAFQLRSPLALTTAVGFAVVMVTGFIGRFLYALAPRVDESVLRDAVAELESRLPGIRPQVEKALRAHPIIDRGSIGLLSTLAALPGWRRLARQRRRAIRLAVDSAAMMASMSRKLRRWVRAASRPVERAAAHEVRSHAAATLLQSWRSLHRFFALLMLMCVIVHVTMALHYGYHWIFSK
jgi:hypothetical protein